MRSEDFVVEELARLPLDVAGDFAIYRVEKRDVTTLQVQHHMAAQLKRRSADVQAPALKDKQAVAIQHVWVRGTGPAELSGPGYQARFVGRSRRPLRPSDLSGNRFTITLRDLSPDKAAAVSKQLHRLARHGLPNYFDRQRFGSYISQADAPNAFIGKTILQRDAEGAVRDYLARPFVGDPSPVRAFKRVAQAHWGEWAYLLVEAPRPSNYRSVLTFLKDHPQDFRKALNLVPRRLLSLYVVAYQSYLWNRIAGEYLARRLATDGQLSTLTILGLALPVYSKLPDEQFAALKTASIPLPEHRAVYADPILAAVVQEALSAEGLALNDLKARILQRAYLPRGHRPLLLFPADVTCDQIDRGAAFPGRQACRLSFTLPAGAFATLVLKRLGQVDDDHQPEQ